MATWSHLPHDHLAACPSLAPSAYPQRLLSRPPSLDGDPFPGSPTHTWGGVGTVSPPVPAGPPQPQNGRPGHGSIWNPEEMAAQLVMSLAMWPVHQPCTSLCLPSHMHRVTRPGCSSSWGPSARPSARARATGRLGGVVGGLEDPWEDLAGRTSWLWPRRSVAGKHQPDGEFSPASAYPGLPACLLCPSVWPHFYLCNSGLAGVLSTVKCSS